MCSGAHSISCARALQLLERAGSGQKFDLIITDEHFGFDCMLGSQAVKILRAQGSQQSIIICSGNDSDLVHQVGHLADGMWGKPYPNWQDGSMLQEVVTVLKRREKVA